MFDVDTALLALAIGVPTDYPVQDPARTHLPLLENIADVYQLEMVDISGNIRIQHALETVKIYHTMNNKCTLFGTIDPSGVITLGSPDDVERETIKILQIYKKI